MAGSPDSRGVSFEREHPDELALAAPALVIDRQRVVRCSAFRRLSHKTQAFLTIGEDHARSRLTHSLEVAHLARRLASALELSEALAEVAALAHDLGHTPFGHAGERALDECLSPHGGFEHNVHSLRVVEQLEHPYPDFPGLNLTRAVRECLAKHATRFDQPGQHPLADGTPPPPEGRIVALADRLTYSMHDLADAVHAELLGPGELARVRMWREAAVDAIERRGLRAGLRPALDRMQERVVADAAAEYRRCGAVGLSAEMEGQVVELEAALLQHVYRNERLVRMDERSKRVLIALYEAFVDEPAQMPERFSRRVNAQPAWRVAADYIAGMTDRFALEEHARLFDPRAGGEGRGGSAG